MDFVRSPQRFVKSGLAILITASMSQFVFAANNQDEIQQLRAEIQELRALVQQQAAQNKVNQVAGVPSAPVTQTTVKDLTLKTAGGAEAKLYGFVRGDASYQAAGGSDIFNRIDAVALDGSGDDKLYSTATTTRVGVDFKTPIAGAEVGGKVEVDFRGTNDGLRIRHAYLTYDNWLIGQTTSSFSNLEVSPEMLDFNLNLGSAYNRRPMVRYSDKLTSGTQYFIGLEKGEAANRLPTLTAKVNQSFAGDRGLVTGRTFIEENRGTGTASGKTSTGWGAGIGANFKVTPELKVMADYMHAEGNKNLTTFANAAVAVVTNELENNEFDAFSLGATYQVNPKLRGTIGYGMMFAEDSNQFAAASSSANKELQQGWINLMYSPVKPITFGLEYVYGERETFKNALGETSKGKDNRVGAMARYSF